MEKVSNFTSNKLSNNMEKKHFDVLIIGAGISGISAAYYLQKQCPNKSFAILEGRNNFGGTWDLFKYPGIRSDSDMYTLGFAFHPWTSEKAIADGPSIMSYLNETLDEFDLRKYIHYSHKVVKAEWSSPEALWYLEVQILGKEHTSTFTCNFLSMCSGYYNYEHGYTPKFEGIENFKGKIIHPQKWPEYLDYGDKKIIVIGSGATAVTLIPELTKKANKVTMLQRSPTYMISRPSVEKLPNFLNKILPHKIAYSINRWWKINMQRFSFFMARKYPKRMAKMLTGKIEKELGSKNYNQKDFQPRYNPWEQRLCLVPDSDFFEAIKSKKASIETSHIESFVENGIQLKSGKILEADIIVTATGLDLKLMGGIPMLVDGESVDLSKKVWYKSMMFNDVPNMVASFGYVNASWTLKCDLSNQYVCRLINFMEEKGYQQCTPRLKDDSMQLENWVDFSSGYFQRKMHLLPKKGTKGPWRNDQNYLADKKIIGKGKIDDGVLEFKAIDSTQEKTKTHNFFRVEN